MKQIIFIAPNSNMFAIAKQETDGKYPGIVVREGLLSEGLALAKKAVAEGARIIISRGATAALIRRAGLPVVVVEVPITAFDLIRALERSGKKSVQVGLVAFPPMVVGFAYLGGVLGRKVRYHPLLKEEDAPGQVRAALRDGADIVVGGVVTGEAARAEGCPYAPIETGAEGIRQAIEEAVLVEAAQRQEQERAGLFGTVLAHAHEGIVSVNGAGEVTVFNPRAAELTGIKAADALGRNIAVVWPQLFLGEALAKGEEKTGLLLNVKGRNLLCNQLPVLADGRPVGAVVTMQDAGEIQKMEETVRKRLYATGHVAGLFFKDIIGSGKEIERAVHIAKQYALTDSSIVIAGETGSGKEVFAQSIHNHSRRKNGAFVAINCAALASQILESELFGYVAGACTGASQKGKPGLIELAHGGTLFLDEIGEMELATQSKLLRVLEEKKVMRLGSDKLLPVDVRVITASNRDLRRCVEEQTFRRDLYYRLNVLKLSLPALRERPEDIEELAGYFLRQKTSGTGAAVRLTAEAARALKSYSWPGNVRELQNILERILAVHKGGRIDGALVRKLLEEENEPAALPQENLLKDEKSRIQNALELAGGHQGRAAELLGLHRSTLWRKLKKYSLL